MNLNLIEQSAPFEDMRKFAKEHTDLPGTDATIFFNEDGSILYDGPVGESLEMGNDYARACVEMWAQALGVEPQEQPVQYSGGKPYLQKLKVVGDISPRVHVELEATIWLKE